MGEAIKVYKAKPVRCLGAAETLVQPQTPG